MQTPAGETLDVFIYASTLHAFDFDPVGPVGLLKRHRALLERIASEKYDQEGTPRGNFLHITDDDLPAAEASEANADDPA